MRIISAGSALPEHAYGQEAVTGALKSIWQSELSNPETLDRLHARCGVEQRYFTLPLETYPTLKTWGQSNDVWIKTAQELGETAIRSAITPAGIDPKEIAAIFFVSITGICSPSIDAKLVNRMKLSRNIKRIPIFGLGCVAGAAGLSRAADYVRAFPDQIAVVLSVELCSLTWQNGDLSMANLISTGLFGDGAAAVIVAGKETRFKGPEILATKSTFYSNTEDTMGWAVSENGFRIVLSPDVPLVIKENLRKDADSFLQEFGLTRKDISSWIIHTGGPKVLEAIADALELPEKSLEASWECLRRVGNLSSASVLMVLEDVLQNRRGAPGTYSVLAAMGPGFCSELLLIRW